MPGVGLHQAQIATFRYKFSEHGGAVGAIELTGAASGQDGNELPDNALILRAWTENLVAVAGGVGATIELGITGNTNAFEAATAITDASYATPGTIDSKAAELPLKVDNAAGVAVIATVAAAALTAGEFDVHVEYLPGR